MGGKTLPICSRCDRKAESVYRHHANVMTPHDHKVEVWRCPECSGRGVRVWDVKPSPSKAIFEEGPVRVELVPFDELQLYRGEGRPARFEDAITFLEGDA